MPAELPTDFHLEIAHVLVMDIVGYSKLLIDEQGEFLQQLNQIGDKRERHVFLRHLWKGWRDAGISGGVIGSGRVSMP